MAVTLNITGTLSLNINDGVNYLVDWNSDGTSLIEPGTVAWRREMVTSPYVSGAYEAGAVLDIVQASVTVNIFASSAANLTTAVTNIKNAFVQSTYTLALGLDGQTYSWTCLRADYTIGLTKLRTFNDSTVQWTQGVFAFPRQPVPVAGPY